MLYGDGVFRTMLLRNGRVQQWHRQYSKLLKDCNSINLPCPAESVWLEDLMLLTQCVSDGIVKATVTRGLAQRGYAPTPHPTVSRILGSSPPRTYPDSFYKLGVRLHLCQLRLGYQPRLAGIKHLNRLENVLASSEWDDEDIAEGLLLDESGYVIEGVRSNIFMVKGSNLLTPELSRCGVAGVQRERVIEWAAQQGMLCKYAHITLDELLQADEIFLVNSVIGLWPVREIANYCREHHPVSYLIQDWLANESH